MPDGSVAAGQPEAEGTIRAADPSHESGHELALARTFASISRQLLAKMTLEETLRAICGLAVEVVDGCDHAGISFVEGRRVTTRATTDALPEAVDAMQYRTDEGPCLDAIREHEVLELPDLQTETRWPAFCESARNLGVGAMLAFRLFADDRTLGALNLYSETPGAFGGTSTAPEVGAIFAAHAAVAVAGASDRANLEEALATRSSISLAMGLLMARQQVTEDEAFVILRRASQRTNVKLRDIASQVTARHGRAVDANRRGPRSDSVISD